MLGTPVGSPAKLSINETFHRRRQHRSLNLNPERIFGLDHGQTQAQDKQATSYRLGIRRVLLKIA